MADIRIRRNLEIDHLVPTSKGGSEDILNKVTACAACNLDKQDFDPSDGRPGALNPITRDQFVAVSRRHIENYRATICERENYDLLLAKIKTKTN
jgi:hypothetical protein